MSDTGANRTRWGRVWLLAFAAVTPVGLLFAGVSYLLRMNAPPPAGPLSIGRALTSLFDWYFWAALAPLVVWLARRVRVERDRWARALGTHLALGLAVTFGELSLWLFFSRVVIGGGIAASSTYWDALRLHLGLWAGPGFVIYGVIVAAVHAVDHEAEARAREVRLADMERRLAEAQLHALRMQLHPHFLFNTLHTIAVFMREGRGREAIRMMGSLGDFLRRTLRSDVAQEVPLQQELEFVGAYLDIERQRFGDRLTVDIAVDPDVLAAPVPYMILQPLVENAVKHGAARRRARTRVRVEGGRENGSLVLRVIDDGQGFPPALLAGGRGNGDGIGLANVRARLARLYGAGHRFALAQPEGGGAAVEIALPLRGPLPREASPAAKALPELAATGAGNGAFQGEAAR